MSKTKKELLAEAHRKYVETVEKARKEYIETKKRLYPELYQAETIEQLKARVKELEEKLKLKEEGK